jgi:hypothetical protein
MSDRGSSDTWVCMEMDGRRVMTLNSFVKIPLSLAFLMRQTSFVEEVAKEVAREVELSRGMTVASV